MAKIIEVSGVKVEVLSMAELEAKERGSLWVLNNTKVASPSGKDTGGLTMTITMGNGKNMPVRVPRTFVPIDLSTKVTRTALMDAPEFRDMLNKGMLVAISEESALALLEQPRYKRENDKVLNRPEASLTGDVSPAAAEYKPDFGVDDSEIRAKIQNLAGVTEENDALVSQMDAEYDSLTKEELQYLVDNAKTRQVKAYAAQILLDRNL